MTSLWLLLLASLSQAATIVGRDYGNTALHPSNGDVLSGTFTNVSLFQVDAGASVFVEPDTPLAVYAATVTISGVLDGSGRGKSGGSGGGPPSGAGSAGFDADAAGTGGQGGAGAKGGGGGAAASAGGVGAGAGGGAAGTPGYGSTGTVTIPLSADDAEAGSGGGGGGANGSLAGGTGGAGGAAIYIEASSMTLYGAILANGATAAAVTDSAAGTHPGGGGGGGGGTILLRITGPLFSIAGSSLSASGGPGGNVTTSVGGTLDPGGGGAGGRVKVFYGAGSQLSLTISTAAGKAGGSGGFPGSIDASAPAAGGAGAASFGVVASSATSFAASSVYITSVAWTWTAAPSFGDGPTLQQYRVFPGTSTAPLGNPEAISAVVSSTVTALTPNTTYFRFVTAYTDWGNSAPSNGATAYTLADAPAAAATAFPALSPTSITFSWTAGTNGNPAYTQYEVSDSTSPGFAAPVSTSLVVGLSSAAANLLPNTTYYFRARAVNLVGVQTAFTAVVATATLAAQPGTPGFGTVFVTSASFVWSANGNPAGTQYVAQLSTDNFFSLNSSSQTLGLSATFFSLTPGTQLYFRVAAVNWDSVTGAYSVVVTTKSGNLSDTTPPSTPGTPVADRQFSYDGTALFAWPAATSSVGILDYNLIVGTLPGASDIFAGNVVVASFSVAGLPTGKTIYAQARARSNAGVYGSFSSVSAGLPVFNTQQASAIAQPYNWPNPFDPRQGPTQIGFFLEQPATVVLKIFTLQGRLVHEESKDYGAGNQIAAWSGSNDAGSRVAPGGYVVMLQKRYPGRVDTQKLKVAVLY